MQPTARRPLLVTAGTLFAVPFCRKVLAQSKPGGDLAGTGDDDATYQPTIPPAALPAISFADGDGTTHTLGEYAGRVVVLNFWATWCPPCIAELPTLEALAGKLDTRQFAILTISVDRGGANTVRGYYGRHDINKLPVLCDPHSEAMHTLGLHGLPTTLLLDAQGREHGRLEGGTDWSSDAAIARIRALTVRPPETQAL